MHLLELLLFFLPGHTVNYNHSFFVIIQEGKGKTDNRLEVFLNGVLSYKECLGWIIFGRKPRLSYKSCSIHSTPLFVPDFDGDEASSAVQKLNLKKD